MSDTMLSVLLILLPAWAICAIFYGWSRHSRSAILSRVLALSAIGWAMLLTTCFIVMGIAVQSCGGNLIYGYTDCTLLSDRATNTISTLTVLSFLAAIAYGAIATLIGAVVEIIAHRRAT